MSNDSPPFTASIPQLRALLAQLEAEILANTAAISAETLANIEDLLAAHLTVTQAVKVRVESWMSGG